MRRALALSLALLLPPAAAGQEILDLPYVALRELDGAEHSPSELKSLRSSIEERRDHLIDACKKEEERLKNEIGGARKKLNEMNGSSSRDTGSMAEVRSRLHAAIAAAEEALRKTEMECEPVLSAAFEIKIAKLRVLEEWPERREEIVRAIEEGRARGRKYGDIEDIGYRKLFDGQEKDIAVGEQAVRRMQAGGLIPGELQDSYVQEYARRLTAKIAANSDLKVPLHVTVVNGSEIDATALPGGFLFISSGLILAAATESELAGAIAQEIARIAARHGARASKRSGISTIFVQAAHVATGLFTGGLSNAGALYGINYGFQGLGMFVDRSLIGAKGKYQKEADQLGIQYAWKAGFDPKGSIALLDSIAQKEYSKTASFFRTHPGLDERLLSLFAEIEFLPVSETYTVDSPEFQQIKKRIQE